MFIKHIIKKLTNNVNVKTASRQFYAVGNEQCGSFTSVLSRIDIRWVNIYSSFHDE